MDSKHFLAPRYQTILSHILSQNKLANGYIFTGPEGTFIKKAALSFIQGANCESFVLGGCGTCEACAAYIHNRFVDYFYLGSDSFITIEQIRELKEYVKFGVRESRYLMVFVDGAELLTLQAANAFLKVLEEPLPQVSFVLCTHELSALLPTIRSRCQLLLFELPSLSQLKHLFSQSPELKSGDMASCMNSRRLMALYLEDRSPALLDMFVTFEDFLKKTLFERLLYIQRISEDKSSVISLITFWIQSNLENNVVINAKDFPMVEKMFEKLKKLKYNLNLRLQFESLVLQL